MYGLGAFVSAVVVSDGGLYARVCYASVVYVRPRGFACDDEGFAAYADQCERLVSVCGCEGRGAHGDAEECGSAGGCGACVDAVECVE